jgi:predicted PurR-regulated permease PerM
MKLSQWLGLFCLMVAGYLLWQIRQLLLLLFMAIVLTTALNRLVRSLERFNLKRKTAVFLTLLTAALLTVLFFWLVVPPFIEQFQNLIVQIPRAWAKIREWGQTLQAKELEWEWFPDFLAKQDPLDSLQTLVPRVFQNFFSIFSNSVTAFLQILFVLAMTIMMLLNPQGYRRSAL